MRMSAKYRRHRAVSQPVRQSICPGRRSAELRAPVEKGKADERRDQRGARDGLARNPARMRRDALLRSVSATGEQADVDHSPSRWRFGSASARCLGESRLSAVKSMVVRKPRKLDVQRFEPAERESFHDGAFFTRFASGRVRSRLRDSLPLDVLA